MHAGKIWISQGLSMSRAEFIRFLEVLEKDLPFRALFQEAEP